MCIEFSVLSWSEMLVEINSKKLILQGEATLTPAFYADANSIKHWEAPHQMVEITEEEKAELIQKISRESQKGRLKVIFNNSWSPDSE